MREIKFRAWDGQKMFTPDAIANVNYAQGQACTFPGNKDVVNHPDAIVMQYTGQQDKNGNDIYEGDVCLRHYGGSLSPAPFKVVVENLTSGFYWIPQHKQHPYDVGFKPFWVDEDNEWRYCFERDIEVIGNIYENPELQEDKP